MKPKKISDGIWELPKEEGMLVPARVYATEKLLNDIESGAMQQLKNTAYLQGIQKWVIGESDMHYGYGFPIGGVAGMSYEGGVISPGGIGFDVNCTHPNTKIVLQHGVWVRIKEMKNKLEQLQPFFLDMENLSLKKTNPIFCIEREENGFIYEITLKTGRKLKVTSEHPILTKDGMKKAAELGNEFVAAYPFSGIEFEEPSDEIILSEEDIIKILNNLGITTKGNAETQVLNYLKKLNILPLRYNSPQIPALLKIFGFVLGDGAISFINKRKGFVNFYASNNEDLENIKKDIISLGFKCPNIFSRRRKHEIKTNYNVVKFECDEKALIKKSTAFAVLLVGLGAPFGVKTHKSYRVPKWIMKAPLWQKRLFIATFFGAELAAPSTLNKYNFYELQLNMNKSIALKENAVDFLNDVRFILLEFGVKSAYPVEVEGYKYSGKRGNTSGLRIKILSNPNNLIRFFEKISYEYNHKKQAKACLAASYLRMKEHITKKRNDARCEAIKLYNEGRNINSVRDKLTEKYVSAQFINHSVWTKFKNMPRISFDFDSFHDYCEKHAFGNEGFIWEEVDEIKKKPYSGSVYDITMNDHNHNFIANNFVVSNCGVRLLKTNLAEKDLKGKMKALVDKMFIEVPSGLGSKGKMRLKHNELNEAVVNGAEWAVGKGYGTKKDLEHTEENGKMKGADSDKLSIRAVERGLSQFGTLGSGNHFLEVQVVDEVYDGKTAEAFGLEKGQVVFMLHSGSRGFGHQVATDYLKVMDRAMEKYGIKVPDRQLACAPITSNEGQDYFTAMVCAVNYAFCNRQIMAHWVRESFADILGRSAEDMEIETVYDICHNVAKIERHKVDGQERELLVHRKGATRAFPAGREENPKAYEKTGHPALIPGSMGTASYVMVGTKKGLEETFGSVAHGAGRVMSRNEAMRRKTGEQVKKELEEKGETIRGASWDGLAEEAPDAYKDIDEVALSVELSGIGRKITRHAPLAVIKG